MPTVSYYHAYVRCPYYRGDDGKSQIRCEGVWDGATLSQHYKRKEDFRTQIRVFCCGHYKKCELYEVLERKYEE